MKLNAQFARLTLAGLELGMSVTLGAVGGMFLDKQFDTQPWLMIGGLVLGVASGFLNIYRLMIAVENSKHDSSESS